MSNNNKQPRQPRVRKYRLTLADDQTHRQIKVAKFSRWSFFLTVAVVFVTISVCLMMLIALTPLKSFIPGYPDADTRKASVQNAIQIDSLRNVVSKWEFYSENLKRVFAGEDPVRIDSIIRNYSAGYDTLDAGGFRQSDSLLRQTVMEAEQFSIGPGKNRALPIEGKHFFTPLKGLVTEKFEQVTHPYMVISAPASSVVMAVLDGTVISADWSEENQYTLIIQHQDNIISIYRKNQKLLHKAGDIVKAGSPVALVGSSGGDDSEYISFGLWYDGKAVDPEKYISF